MHWHSTFQEAKRKTLARSTSDTRAQVVSAFDNADPVAHESRSALMVDAPHQGIIDRARRTVRRVFSRSDGAAYWTCARASMTPGAPFNLYRNQTRVATGDDRDELIRSADPDATIES